MKLLEYEAKGLLRSSGVLVPRGIILIDNDQYGDAALPIVVKSQVPTGGRGKAGGIRVATTEQELRQTTKELFALAIKGHTPRSLLAEELLPIKQEYYVSLVVSRERGCVEIVAHTNGGVEIESHSASEFFRRELNIDNCEGVGDSLAEYLGLAHKSFVLQGIIERLYNCFVTNDATLLEINPLVLTLEGTLVAGDCKMVLDDAAYFRHPDWKFEERPADANFVVLDQEGTVATIANGAGLAMSTVDAVKDARLNPANFLDIGGGATTEKVVESFRRITQFPHVSAIIINIFGGIVRCDTVARAIIEATHQLPDLPVLYIRLSGNRSYEAAELLSTEHLTLYATLEDCLGAMNS
jgi:succinyl-CoA synthetase beta subunit